MRRSKISSAVFVQTKGLGLSFQSAIQYPGVSQAAVTALSKAADGASRKVARDLADKRADYYARAMSEPELKAAIAFFQTDAGKSLLSAQQGRGPQDYTRAIAEMRKAIVKDFWAEPSYASLLQAMQKRVHDYVVADQGTAKDALDSLVKDWTQVFQDDGKL